ncbi:MAG: 6-bladed beta-propeller [Ardenticatenaceae bacterium]|nr:hypothetical protein [Anaerolineales bacterium]MCB8979823.1 6-bladed beta-propeller [Ardenticatenaceae bacterium]
MELRSRNVKPISKTVLWIGYLAVFFIFLVGCNRSDSAESWRDFAEPDTDLSLPTGLAVDSVGNVYVFDSGSHRVLKFDPAGALLRQWGGEGPAEGQFNCYEDKGTICGLAVDGQDNVYVVDKGNYRIQKFDADGNFLLSWGSQGTGDGQFVRPIYVAVDAQGHVFVTDDRNPVVQKFDADGVFLGKWGSQGAAAGQFYHATGIAVDSEGNVYISDYENQNIQKFDNNGRFLLTWKTGTNARTGTPEAIAIDANDRIYVTDSELKQVEIFDQNGETLQTIALPGLGLLNRISPYGIAVDLSGNLLVTDRANNRIVQYAVPVWTEITE